MEKHHFIRDQMKLRIGFYFQSLMFRKFQGLSSSDYSLPDHRLLGPSKRPPVNGRAM